MHLLLYGSIIFIRIIPEVCSLSGDSIGVWGDCDHRGSNISSFNLLALSDSISHLGEGVSGSARSAYGLTDFVLRGLFVFGLPTLVCGFFFARGNRSQQLQWVLGVAGILAGMLFPLNVFAQLAHRYSVFVVGIGGVLLLLLPSFLPVYLFARRDRQRRAMLVGYVFLSIMFLINL